MMSNEEIDYRLAAEQLRSGKPLFGVRQLNCVKLHCQDLLGDNPERLFLGKLRLGSMPSLSFSPLVA